MESRGREHTILFGQKKDWMGLLVIVYVIAVLPIAEPFVGFLMFLYFLPDFILQNYHYT